MLSHYQVSKGGSNAKEMVKISLGSDTYRVDKVVGEDPEVNSDMPHEEPHNHSYNCSRNLKPKKEVRTEQSSLFDLPRTQGDTRRRTRRRDAATQATL